MNTELQEQLKTLVDEHSLTETENIRASSQDKRTAGAWEDAGRRIARLASKCDL
jgi:hypothetical protein